MSNEAERALIELVAREQRGVRGVVFAGISVVLLLVAMSVAMAIVFYTSAESLRDESRRLSKNAFDSRRQLDQQVNRVSGLEAYTRTTYEEIRSLLGNDAGSADCSASLGIAAHYLQTGTISLADERVLGDCSAGPGGEEMPPERRALLTGAASLRTWERSRDTVSREGEGRPEELEKAHAQFQIARGDPSLTHLAANGLAWVEFIMASSERYDFAAPQCSSVNVLSQQSTVSANGGEIALQPLYWIGQCSRKMAQSLPSLEAYGRALEKIQAARDEDPARGEPAEAELFIEMNAFHGLGTVLISTRDNPEDARLTAARQLAEDVCKPEAGSEGVREPLVLARACLDKAMALRQKLRQTRNQVSGSKENLTFIHLRARETQLAYENTKEIEKTGLFAWNELMRALTAEKLAGEIRASKAEQTGEERQKASEQLAELEDASRIARRNVSHFSITQFNLCEIEVLLPREDYQQALKIIYDEHRRFSRKLEESAVACQRGGAT